MKAMIFILLCAIPAFAQDVSTLEWEYQKALELSIGQQARVDSLNQHLDNLATLIDREKERPAENRQKVQNMMAQALELTKKIQDGRSSLKERGKELEKKRIALYSRYTAIIDSLDRLGKEGGDDDIRNERLSYAEKRILISESVQALAFDPQKVQSIRLDDAEDALERRLLSDYLENALSEVDEKVIEVNKTRAELEDVLLLRERASAFLQSVDSDGIVGFLQTENGNPGIDRESSDLGASYDKEPRRPAQYFSQVQSYLSLASQLELQSATPLNPHADVKEIEKLTLSGYVKFLERIEKQLQEYRSVISNKLRNESN